MRQMILVIDDSHFIQKIVELTLQDTYDLRFCSSAEEAVDLLGREVPSLILLDVTLTGMSGFEFFEYILSKPALRDIPVIFLALEGRGTEKIKAIEMGAIDYIAKPFTPSYLRARVDLFAKFVGSKLVVDEKTFRLQRFSEELQNIIDMKTERIMILQDTLIRSAGELVDCRDDNTGGHIRRTEEYVEALGNACIEQGIFRGELNDTTVKMLRRVAPLHDVGKIKIPDSILFKPGPLTKDEYEQMKTHTTLGSEIIERISLGAGNPHELDFAKEIALTHHERWDGGGYPRGLSSTDIPLSGRIMAIADVFDALISKRVYKEAFDMSVAVHIINSESGRHFDPELVDIFNKVVDKFDSIYKQFSDEENVTE